MVKGQLTTQQDNKNKQAKEATNETLKHVRNLKHKQTLKATQQRPSNTKPTKPEINGSKQLQQPKPTKPNKPRQTLSIKQPINNQTPNSKHQNKSQQSNSLK